MKAPKLMTRPLVHFALLGLILFVGVRWLRSSEPTEPGSEARIVVSQSKAAALVSQYESRSGKAATDDVQGELVEHFAEEEMLYRESLRWGLADGNQAIDLRLRQIMAFVAEEELSDEELEREAKALGLDSSDAVIRGMLAQNMRLLLSRRGEREPTGEEVAAYYANEHARFVRPARLTGRHVFFSKDVRQSSAHADARATRQRLDAAALKPEQAIALGDVSPQGARFTGQLSRQLAARFGQEFASIANDLPEGQWSDPVETSFGVHLVLIQERTDPVAPPLAEVRNRVAAAYQSSQRHARLAAAMNELRARYEVVIE